MTKATRSELIALLALFAGALALGSSGIFVRVSETGPLQKKQKRSMQLGQNQALHLAH